MQVGHGDESLEALADANSDVGDGDTGGSLADEVNVRKQGKVSQHYWCMVLVVFSRMTPTSMPTPASVKGKGRKTEDDSIPLPDPFPLPKHYAYNVEVALRGKKVTSNTKRKFLSDVASTHLVTIM